MILKGISVNQNPPTKDYLWITPKGNTRFWDQSTWRLIGGSGGGGTNLPDITAAGKYLITAGSSGDYYATWGDLNLNSYISGDIGYAAVFNGSNSITSAKLTNSKIRIGDGIIEWDSTNNGFKIYNATSTQETPTTAGIYADWVSALGPNSSGGGGGGSDLDWESLITWDEDPEHIININYLPISLSNGVITIGNNSITPLTSHQDISGKADKTITITGTNGLSGGGTLEQSRTIGIDSTYKEKLDDVLSMFELDSNGDIKTKDKPNNGGHRGLYSESFVSALGTSSSGGGGGGINWDDFWNELNGTHDPSEHYSGSTIIDIDYLPINKSTNSFYAPITAGTSGYFLKSNGAGSAPSWQQIYSWALQSTKPSYNKSEVGLSNVTNDAQIAKSVFSGAYQIMYSTAASTPAVLSPNTNGVKRFLSMKGTGSVGAAPQWSDITNDDLPAIRLGESDVSGILPITKGGTGNTTGTATKLGTSNVGNPITPFYLNTGTATVCSIYRYHYDSTSDWSSYTWHKVAYATQSALADYNISFLVAAGNTGSRNGILRCRCRWNSDNASTPSPVYDTAQINWVINNGIAVDNFVLVWKSPYLELWCKIPGQWQGYQFTVLDSGYRANNGALTWTLCDSINGHGNASYTSGGTVITSSVATLTNNLSGTVSGYTISSTVNSGTANRLAYYTSSGIDDASTTYVSDTKLAINSTSEPSYNLYVNGTSYLNGQTNTQNIVPIANSTYNIGASNNVYSNIYSNNYVVNTGSATSGLYKNSSITSSGTSTTLWLYNSNLLKLYGSAINLNANVGIGTDSPAYKLDVSGVINATDVIVGYAYTKSNNMAAFVFDKPGSNLTGMGAIGVSDTIHFGPCSRAGAWVSSYNQKWEFQGDIYALGGVTALATISSDKRLKKEIKPFNAKQIIDKLKPVEFEWNKKANKYNSNLELNKKNYGLIAQDSDNIIDDFVFDLPDNKGYKGVRYEKLIPILLQAVKEQQKEIDELKQIIKKLKV